LLEDPLVPGEAVEQCTVSHIMMTSLRSKWVADKG